MAIKTDPNCSRCEGKGWFYVPNGPDDVDKEVCDCAEVEEGDESYAREHQNTISENGKEERLMHTMPEEQG